MSTTNAVVRRHWTTSPGIQVSWTTVATLRLRLSERGSSMTKTTLSSRGRDFNITTYEEELPTLKEEDKNSEYERENNRRNIIRLFENASLFKFIIFFIAFMFVMILINACFKYYRFVF
ncbi:uncharacterized protein LOC143230543 [Tachypleus tridentatus]|uniref:uncharacterized protein LOC143230543 n=1 Tax=Tachypleus tridentatus TaxID=6853 RepID=UPI003FD063F8